MQFEFVRRAATAALSCAALIGSSAAQGADDCANAQVITGTGDWNFLLFTATTDGSPDGVCDFFGQQQIENDVWFEWTATVSGSIALDTCVTSTVDTKVAVYAGTSCSGSPIACNDDADCGLQSRLSFPATAGQAYLIRVGTYPGAAVGGGQIHVVEPGGGAGTGADDCANAEPISGTGTFAFDNSSATTDGLADGACDFFGQTQIDSDIWFAWTATSDDSFTLQTCGQTGVDTKIAVYDGTSCPATAPIACNDDACALQSSVNFQASVGATYLVRIGTFPGAAAGMGTFSIDAGGGGSCANPASGADVIIGELIGVESYGGLGNQSSFAIGTTSCNVGSDELLWIASTNEHPVISQNIYRLENGRFEQIGMGWLKHGFTALQGSVCCTCISSGTGSRLGVGCSDPYSASLNGQQGSLGPRSEVNAYDGTFPYPFNIGFNQTGDRVYKRIQVENSDIDPGQRPSALYFGEGHYVTPDDAQAGNGFNNASYRAMSVTGALNGGFGMTMTGATVRTEPAIQAWKDTDPTVNLQDVAIPGEGLFKVASNAYDNGDGTWRYEYAIHNLNSDFSGRAFSVFIGSGVNVTGAGMSFPAYHSGEPYSNLPWTTAVTGTSVSWSSELFLQDPNANALRWGTVYSFWFTANTAPETRTASLGLFKPGNPGTQSMDVIAPMDGSGGPTVTNYCSANANSTGTSTSISATNIDLVGRTMDLDAVNMPTNAFGFFITSTTQAFVPNAGGSAGNLCVGGDIGRGVGAGILTTGSTGSFGTLVDLDVIPTPFGTTSVMAGETRNFQAWHRDALAGVPTSNFSDGVAVSFP